MKAADSKLLATRYETFVSPNGSDHLFSFNNSDEGGTRLPLEHRPLLFNPESADIFPAGILPPQESDWAGIGTPQADVTRFRVDF